MHPTLKILILLCLPALSYAQEKPAKKDATEPYAGFRADQAQLRKQFVFDNPGGMRVKASSAEACTAAHNIFSRVSFLFKSRDEVLEILGDPATISDYNRPAGKEPGSPLVYIFDSGFGGWKYTISFDKLRPEVVMEVKAEGQD